MVDLLLARTGSTLDNDRGSVLDRCISDDDRLEDWYGIDGNGCGFLGSDSLGLGLLDLFHQLSSTVQSVTYDRLGRSHETKQGSEHSNQSEECSGETGSDIWHLLASLEDVEAT